MQTVQEAEAELAILEAEERVKAAQRHVDELTAKISSSEYTLNVVIPEDKRMLMNKANRLASAALAAPTYSGGHFHFDKSWGAVVNKDEDAINARGKKAHDALREAKDKLPAAEAALRLEKKRLEVVKVKYHSYSSNPSVEAENPKEITREETKKRVERKETREATEREVRKSSVKSSGEQPMSFSHSYYESSDKSYIVQWTRNGTVWTRKAPSSLDGKDFIQQFQIIGRETLSGFTKKLTPMNGTSGTIVEKKREDRLYWYFIPDCGSNKMWLLEKTNFIKGETKWWRLVREMQQINKLTLTAGVRAGRESIGRKDSELPAEKTGKRLKQKRSEPSKTEKVDKNPGLFFLKDDRKDKKDSKEIDMQPKSFECNYFVKSFFWEVLSAIPVGLTTESRGILKRLERSEGVIMLCVEQLSRIEKLV